MPGNYYYYDSYNHANKGEIIVHPATFVGTAGLAVDMNPANSSIIENYVRINGTSFSVSIDAVNAVNLSSWRICVEYDSSIIEATSLNFGPQWDASTNPNALGTGGIYQGSGLSLADSFLLSGTPGINATGPERLFSVSFRPVTCGLGTVGLAGYMSDSNGNYIQYSRLNGIYRLVPTACLLQSAGITGQNYPGSTITLHNSFFNEGQNLVMVTSSKVTASFGTFTQSTGIPLSLTSLTNASLTMPLTIPSNTTIGTVQLTFETHWQYLNQTGSKWINSPTLTFTESLPVTSPPPTPLQLLISAIAPYVPVLVIEVTVWATLIVVMAGLMYRDTLKTRRRLSPITPSPPEPQVPGFGPSP